MNSPIVSIITPSYNSKNVFRSTFDSVISQTRNDWEWIIVDDCSTDGSLEYILSLTLSYPNIIVLQTPKNSGSAAARNIALKRAMGTYITFLDSDDYLEPNYLESQLDFIKQNEPIITAGYYRKASKTNTIFMPRREITYRKLLYGCDTSCLTTMYNREILGDLFFDENLLKDEDFIFWLDILKKGYVVKTNPNVLATYRISKSSKNGSKIKLFKPIFNNYHNVLKMNLVRTFWHMFCYLIYGLKKYHNVK